MTENRESPISYRFCLLCGKKTTSLVCKNGHEVTPTTNVARGQGGAER